MVKKAGNTVLVKEPVALTPSRFKALLENAYDGIVLYDAAGVIQYASPSVKGFFGYTQHDLLGRKGSDFVYSSDVELARDTFYKVLMTPGMSLTQVQRFVTKKGTLRWSEYTLTNLLHNPEVRGIVSNFRDIHEKKVAEEKASKSQKMLNTISDNIVDGIFFGIPGEEFQYVNRAFLEMTGYKSLEELQKIKPHHLYVQIDRWKEINELLKKSGNVKNQHALFRKKNGQVFAGVVSITLFTDKSKQMRFAGSVQDITKQKQAEEQLKSSQTLLDSISKNVNEGIYRSSEKKLQYVNAAFVSMFGYKNAAEVIALDPHELFADKKSRVQLVEKLKKHNRLTNEQVLYKKKNGDQFWGLMSCLMAKSPKGDFYIDGAIRDITKQKEAELKLQKNEQLLGAISKNITEGIYRSVPGKQFAYVNRAFLELFGYDSLEDLNAVKPGELYADKTQLQLIRGKIKNLGEIRNVEALFKKKNGQKFWGAISSIMIKERGKIFYDGAIRDITKQKETEKQLHESRNFLDNVMRTVAAPIFVKDSKHRWVMFNDAFCWFMDRSRKELLNKTDRDFLSREESDEYWKIDNQVLRTGDVVINREKITVKNKKIKHLLTVKSRYVNDQNERFVIGFITDITEIKKREEEISKLHANLLGVMESTHESIYAIDRNFGYIAFNKNHAHMSKLIYGATISIGDSAVAYLKGTPERKWLESELKRAFKGEHFVSEQRVDQPQYRERFIESTYNPIFDRKSKVTGVAVFVRDITDRKKSMEKLKILNDDLVSQNWKLAAQEEELKATLDELSERNFELDQLMYKTSHDLRSPLSSILGLVNLAHLDSTQENHLVYLSKIEDRIKKLDEFIKSMLNYARVNRSEVFYEQVDLKELINSCIHELEYLDNFATVKIRTEVKNERVVFKTDPLRIRIVIGNIISNAFKYYNPAVKSYLKINAVINPQTVELIFKDNGIGIKREYLKKVFDMFYRATEKSQGSGLGMYIVKQAVDKLGGTIKVKSTFGKGTTIKIEIPNN